MKRGGIPTKVSISPQAISLASSPRRPPVRKPSLLASKSLHSVAMTRRTAAACETCWALQPKARHLPTRAGSSLVHRGGGGDSGVSRGWGVALRALAGEVAAAEKGRRTQRGCARRHALPASLVVVERMAMADSGGGLAGGSIDPIVVTWDRRDCDTKLGACLNVRNYKIEASTQSVVRLSVVGHHRLRALGRAESEDEWRWGLTSGSCQPALLRTIELHTAGCEDGK